MSALALSVLLALVSAVAYAAGAIVQERVAATTPARPYAPLRHGAWWAAVALNGLGALLHVGALAYGPLSLVQPLGALTIVFALPMAAVFVRRGAGAAAWRGAIMASAGLAGLLSLTGTADAQSLAGGERLAVALVTAGGVAVLFLVARRVRRAVVRSVLLATAAGGAFGIASVFTKTVAVDWTAAGGPGGPTGQLPSLLAVAGLAATGMMLSQAAYRGAGLAAPLATVTVANPVVAAAVGITLFGEHFRYGVTGTVLALGCGVVAAGGLILLTTERLGAHAEQQRPRGVPARTPVSSGPAVTSVPRVPSGPAARTAPAARTEPPAAATPGPRPRLRTRPAGPPSRTQTATPPALR
ncbi:DMT family transporter [Streptomyces albidochromogenes]|uniref:DMT family transporter n=1 Tax=Streptomyces albidochromogenes TaxID=329524 RepID=UPI001ABF037D|nr:DMT family transporter [Streptomyces albidochromogenes]